MCVAPDCNPLALVAKAQESAAQQKFRIKYVAQDAVYLEGGSANGLKEGQKLIVEHTVAPAIVESRLPNPPAPPSGIVASLQVLSVTPSSAVCAIVSSGESLQVGDFARMSPEVAQKEVQAQQQMRLVGGREYPVIVTFTGADPLSKKRAPLYRGRPRLKSIECKDVSVSNTIP